LFGWWCEKILHKCKAYGWRGVGFCEEHLRCWFLAQHRLNIKQTLAGKIYNPKREIVNNYLICNFTGISENKWKGTVDYLQKLHENPNNVIKILRNEENEVSAIFVLLEKQRKFYKKYGTLIELDETYKTTNAGFTLDHLLIHDNNGVVNPSLFSSSKKKP
jgi:hypothetical protein